MNRRLITDAELIDLIGSVERSAYRWEHQRVYLEPGEDEAIAEWDAGGPGHPVGPHPWGDMLARLRDRGAELVRVRVQDTPLPHYQAWLAHLAAAWSIPSGEQIRVMSRTRANMAGALCLLPTYQDWWLLDSRRIVIMTVDGAGRRVSTELRDGGFAVARARAWWGLAVRLSTPVSGGVLTTS